MGFSSRILYALSETTARNTAQLSSFVETFRLTLQNEEAADGQPDLTCKDARLHLRSAGLQYARDCGFRQVFGFERGFEVHKLRIDWLVLE